MKIVEKVIKSYFNGFYENYLYQMEIVTKTKNMNQNFLALNLYFRGTFRATKWLLLGIGLDILI